MLQWHGKSASEYQRDPFQGSLVFRDRSAPCCHARRMDLAQPADCQRIGRIESPDDRQTLSADSRRNQQGVIGEGGATRHGRRGRGAVSFQPDPAVDPVKILEQGKAQAVRWRGGRSAVVACGGWRGLCHLGVGRCMRLRRQRRGYRAGPVAVGPLKRRPLPGRRLIRPRRPDHSSGSSALPSTKPMVLPQPISQAR